MRLTAGANAWTVISDSTKKELVRLADGNLFLERINRLRLGSWNYRGQDPRTMRHYGPMAQDFYQAFGHDALGTVGNDSTINQADFDGVNLIAIQALYRQVLELKQENAQLRQQVQQQASQQQVRQAVAATAALEERLRRLEAQLSPQAQR
ncbi:tail fiber domain-containing protein [Hymenobacter sp. 15J16-1T3B]|nr:tail fiber domain-containing protein [Hymenobacter sp. 15J16-1T3B]